MTRPFDTINGEKVDFNNPDHIKVILDRNKKLEYFASNKFELHELGPRITISVEFKCPSCGATVEEDFRNGNADNLDEPLIDHILDFKCNCCQTKFVRPIFESEYMLRKFQPKPKLIKQ